MDAAAINYISDMVLSQEYNIQAKGDLYALRSFCRERLASMETKRASQGEAMSKENQEREKRKKDLIEQLIRGREERTKHGKRTAQEDKIAAKKEKCVKKRKVSLGWLHHDNESKYKFVREVKGGGTRVISVDVNATKKDLLEEAVSLFLNPDNNNDYEVDLGSFKGESLQEDEFQEGFTVEKYYAAHKLSRARFYLLTKDKIQGSCSGTQVDTNEATPTGDLGAMQVDPEPTMINSIDSESDSDDSLMQGIFETSKAKENPVSLVPIIGSASERSLLKEEQDLAYHLSLQADQEKNRRKEEEKAQASNEEQEEKNKQLEINIRAARAARVPVEPDEGEPFTVIAVRHPDLGTVRRKFKEDATMSYVYDWVGSLAVKPAYFVLKLVDSKEVVYPFQSVSVAENQVLFMKECKEAPPLNDDDTEVSFLGYGPIPNLEDTVSFQMNDFDYMAMQNIEEELPDELLQSEEEDDIVNEEVIEYGR